MAEMETIWRAFLAMCTQQKTAVVGFGLAGNTLQPTPLALERKVPYTVPAATCDGLLQATMESPHKLVLSILKHT